MEQVAHNQKLADTSALAARLGALVWGVFLIWVGIAFLADVSWGVGLLGVGLITLGAQAARKSLGLSLEWFWMVAGTVFSVWGVWELTGTRSGFAPIGLLPVLCIAIGALVILSALTHKTHRMKPGTLRSTARRFGRR